MIANTMRGVIAQIQDRNVHTPRPMRGAIPRAQNLRFATVSRFARFFHRILREGSSGKCAFPKFQNVRFATAACTKMHETNARRLWSPAAYKNHRFTTVSDVRPARSDERVPRPAQKFAFHHSFGRPTSTK